MCDKKCECHNLERLKGKMEECPPEQVRECHGNATAHPFAIGEKIPEKKDKA